MQFNIALYIAIAITIAALGALFMAVRKPSTTPRQETVGIYLAPLAAAWLIALMPPAADHLFYKGAIVLGMLLALIGVALRESGVLPNYVAHAHLVLTYTLYAYAFTSQTSGWPTPYTLLLIVGAALLYYWLYPSLRELKISVAIYALPIFLATWQALELAIQQVGLWMGWAALAGMFLIIVATLLEAQASFRPPRSPLRPAWASASLPIFLLAQLAIAWSIWG